MGSAAIPIQPPHIDPGLFQRTSGEGSQLEPLIQALQFYKKSKLEEQRNQIDAVRAGSEANLQGAQADTLRANLQRQQEEDEAWRKQVDTAPAPLQPFLRLVDASRGLPPELQHITAAVAASKIPGTNPQSIKDFQGYLRLGLPLDVSGHLAGIKLYDIADTKTPHDPDAIGVPSNYLKWHYTPPAGASGDASRELRAQGMLLTQANKDDQVVQRDLTKAKQQIAQDQWRLSNPKAPAPLVPPQFDPNDPNQVLALHKYVSQHHYDTRLQLNAQTRAAAVQRIHATAMHEAGTTPEANALQQALDILKAKTDSAQAAPPDSSN